MNKKIVFYSRFALSVLITGIVTGQVAWANQNNQSPEANLKIIRAILTQADSKIDLAKVKLTIDHMIDPSVDITGSLKKINSMSLDIQTRLPPHATNRVKLEILKTYLYQAGAWNGNQPFHYDLTDPFGHNIHNKLLTTYLSTHQGNCVSMPILFIILGQKIGLDVTVSTAPNHIFVKYREDGAYYNIEATSGGGFARDVWMRQIMPMSDLALANGVYMQPLTKKQTVVVLVDLLNEDFIQKGFEEARINLGLLELSYYPKYVDAMLHIASANLHIRQRDFMSRFTNPRDISPQQLTRLARLERNITLWQSKAFSLGWQMPKN